MERPPHPPAAERRVAGHRVLHLARLRSTSELARRLAADGTLRTGDAVLADAQTAGHGRRGRPWVTLPGASLAVSVLLAPPPLARPASLVLAAAVASCRALESCGARELRIKWPNDLLREDRKLGGLLAESVPGLPRLVVLGVGLNLALRPGDMPGELSGRAGDAGLPPGEATRDAVLAALLRELDAALAVMGTPAAGALGEEYRRRSWLTGREVELGAGGETLRGRVADVTPEGDLVLEDGRRLAGETVELRAVLPR